MRKVFRQGSNMIRLCKFLMWCAGFAAFSSSIVHAQTFQPVKREILALFDGSNEGSAERSRIHRFAELPLNYLGFVLRYHDIREKLPEPAELRKYRGVLTWFASAVPDSNAYLAWANDVAAMKLQYVILGDIGVGATPPNLFLLNNMLGKIGLRHIGEYISPTIGSTIVRKDGSLVGFECNLDPILPDYPVIENTDPTSRAGLTLQVPVRDGLAQAALVSVSKSGGFAALNYEFCHQRAPTHRGRWLIDPFEFLAAAFARENYPIPDVTTVSGRRLFFSQMHSEGWGRETRIERYRQHPTTSAEVVMREIIEPFNNFPVTLDLRESDTTTSPAMARQSSALTEIYLAQPQLSRPAALAIGTTLSRFDASYPSISSLPPVKSPVRNVLYYAATGDETAYADPQNKRPAEIYGLSETLRNTETPRRLKAYNINFHAFAGQHPSSLQSLKSQFTAASELPLTPITAPQFAKIAAGFFTASIVQITERSWRIENRGALSTVRFDDASELELDIPASIGVLGSTRHSGKLFVALDEAAPTATVVLTPTTLREKINSDDRAVSLVESRWRVSRLITSTCYLSFEAQGFGIGEFIWSGAAPSKRRIKVSRRDDELWQGSATPDATGHLEFKLPVSAIQPVTVEVSCDDTRG